VYGKCSKSVRVSVGGKCSKSVGESVGESVPKCSQSVDKVWEINV